MPRAELMAEAAKRGKYRALNAHLSKLDGSEWRTDFTTLERILGFPLPNSARVHRPWWANDDGSGHSQSMAWTTAGWKTASVDLNAETLAFLKADNQAAIFARKRVPNAVQPLTSAPAIVDFRRELVARLAAAHASGCDDLCVNAGDVHRAVGGYPTPFNRMPVCCQVLQVERRSGDQIVSAPPKGVGASLTIRYWLPRPSTGA